jgi:hypothetical protein
VVGILSFYIYIFFFAFSKNKQFIDMIVNCFQTFGGNYMLQANGWKGTDNVTFNLLTKRLFRNSVV